jgi:hypothetical protein
MDINKMLLDSIDLHVHCSPDGIEDRRVNALQLAQQALKCGMKHVVIKSHQFCTAPLAWMVNKIVNQPVLVGSLVLNDCAGGLNPRAIEVAFREGAKIIWMPTTSAQADIEARSLETVKHEKTAPQGISVLDKDGNLVPEMKEIFNVIKAHDLVLATGHLSTEESIAVANESLKRGIKTILTHPLAKKFGVSFTLEQARDLVNKGAFLEFCFTSCMPPVRMTPIQIINHIEILGADHCLLTTDFGKASKPPPTEGFRMMLSEMTRSGLSEKVLESIVKVNPYKLLFSK